MSVDVPVALLGYGTVGSAVARLLADSADDIERATGHRLRLVRALVRDVDKEREFQPGRRRADDRLRPDPRRRVDRGRRGGDGRPRADRRLPPRAPARRQAGRDREQAAARAPQHGALRSSGRGGRAAPLRGVGLRGDPRDQGAARVARRHERPPRARDRQRDDELHPHAHGGRRRLRRGARRGAAARLRRGRPDRGRLRSRRGREDGDPRERRVRLTGRARRRRLRGDRADPAGARGGRATRSTR